MAGKIILEVTKGELAGKTYEYEEPDRVFVGRKEDCGIVLPENTVSRYHCLLDINPPMIQMQDFGSLNGTFLNDEKIGQRDRDRSWEEAKSEEHEAYELHDGDRIRLGKRCELTCTIVRAEQTDEYGTVVEEDDLPESTADAVSEPAEPSGAEEAVSEPAETPEQEPVGVVDAISEPIEEPAEEPEEKPSGAVDAISEPAEESAEKPEQKPSGVVDAISEPAEESAEEPEQKLSAGVDAVSEPAEEPDQEPGQKAVGVVDAVSEPESEPAVKESEQEPAEEEPESESAAEESDADSEDYSVSVGEQKVCGACGNLFPPTSPDDTLCAECRQDRDNMLGAILAALIGGALREEPAGPSAVKGFDKVALLGRGGMGEVWKVKEQKTGKIYALKTLLPKVAADEKAKALFLREAKLTEFLDHKNVVRTYQTGCSDGTFYILMDLCEGGSVDDLMKLHGGKLPLTLATYIMLQVLDGLDYVHHVDVEAEVRKRGLFGTKKTMRAKGLVHRDLKPGNIFLSDRSDRPVAKVADFGMAKAFQAAGYSTMSDDRAVKGTIPFMPRQQAMDCRFAKPEVDVWAAAASYYHMLTGGFPKNFRPGQNMWLAIVSEPVVPIQNRDPSVPEKIARVIDHALREHPVIGCRDAALLREDLIRALPDEVRDYCKGII